MAPVSPQANRRLTGPKTPWVDAGTVGGGGGAASKPWADGEGRGTWRWTRLANASPDGIGSSPSRPMAERGTPLAAASQSSRPQAASSPCGPVQSAASLLPRQPGSGHCRSCCADDRRACHAARGSVRAPQCELLAAVPATRGTSQPALLTADSSHHRSALQARSDQAARDGRSPALGGELRGGRWGSLRSAPPALWARTSRRASLCALWGAGLGTGVRSWFQVWDRSQGLESEFGSEVHVGNPPGASESWF